MLGSRYQSEESRGAHNWEVVASVEEELVKDFNDGLVEFRQGLFCGIEKGVDGSFYELVARRDQVGMLDES